MGPGPHQPAFLVVEVGELDLQPPFIGLRAVPEDLQDQACAVEHLGRPGLFQVALLDRAERMIDDHQLGVIHPDERGDFLHLAGAEQCGWHGFPERRDQGCGHLQPDRPGEAYGLHQLFLGGARRDAAGLGRMSALRQDDERAGRRCWACAVVTVCAVRA